LTRPPITAGQGFWSSSLPQGLADVRLGRLFQSTFPFMNITELFGSLPWWMWLIEGLGYLLFVAIYWRPGPDEISTCEIRAFACFALVAAILLAVVLWSNLVDNAAMLGRFVFDRA